MKVTEAIQRIKEVALKGISSQDEQDRIEQEIEFNMGIKTSCEICTKPYADVEDKDIEDEGWEIFQESLYEYSWHSSRQEPDVDIYDVLREMWSYVGDKLMYNNPYIEMVQKAIREGYRKAEGIENGMDVGVYHDGKVLAGPKQSRFFCKWHGPNIQCPECTPILYIDAWGLLDNSELSGTDEGGNQKEGHVYAGDAGWISKEEAIENEIDSIMEGKEDIMQDIHYSIDWYTTRYENPEVVE